MQIISTIASNLHNTLECLINMPTQISMSGGKKSKKLIRVLVPNKHVWWKNPKFTGMNFGTDTIIDFLNIFAIFVHEKTKLTEV